MSRPIFMNHYFLFDHVIFQTIISPYCFCHEDQHLVDERLPVKYLRIFIEKKLKNILFINSSKDSFKSDPERRKPNFLHSPY